MEKIKRLEATSYAEELVEILQKKFGYLMFYKAGGCCEGTQPQCFELQSFLHRTNDVCLWKVKGIDFWLDKDLFEYWKFSRFTLDVADGFGDGCLSLETPYAKTFKVIYRLFTEEENAILGEVRLNTY